MHMRTPPFGLPDWDPEAAALPEELQAELRDWVRKSPRYKWLINELGDFAPCLWLDLVTGLCKHYDLRPSVCREYEVGCASCRAARRRGGLSNKGLPRPEEAP